MPPAQNYGTTELRITWDTYWCKKGGKWADIDFFGKKVGGVPSVMVDAYAALEQALTATGYKPPDRCQSLWSYVCRNIASSGRPSLHSYGIAIDIDPNHNPQAHVPPYSGWLDEDQVTAVMSILNPQGGRVWWWGGYWSGFTTPDLMHFQADQGPDRVAVDWSTVAGSTAPSKPDEGGDDLAHLNNEAQQYFQEIYDSLKKDTDKPNKGDANPPGPKLFTYLAELWRYSVNKTGKDNAEGIVSAYLKDK